MPPISSLVIGLVAFHVIIAVGAPVAHKSVLLSKLLVGYAYFLSLLIYWMTL